MCTSCNKSVRTALFTKPLCWVSERRYSVDALCTAAMLGMWPSASVRPILGHHLILVIYYRKRVYLSERLLHGGHAGDVAIGISEAEVKHHTATQGADLSPASACSRQ